MKENLKELLNQLNGLEAERRQELSNLRAFYRRMDGSMERSEAARKFARDQSELNQVYSGRIQALVQNAPVCRVKGQWVTKATDKQIKMAKDIAEKLQLVGPASEGSLDVYNYIRAHKDAYFTSVALSDKQRAYVERIAAAIGDSVPENLNQQSADRYIKKHKKEYHEKLNGERRDQIVNGIRITDYAAYLGYQLVRKGRYYSLKEHDSVMIDPDKNCYWRNSVRGSGKSVGDGGTVIDFSMAFQNLDFKGAVKQLAEYANIRNIDMVSMPEQKGVETKKEQPPERIILPEHGENMHRVFAYLTKSRYIEPEIVQDFVRNEWLYQDQRGNCVFVSSENSTPVFACIRGTNTYKRFMGDVRGCDYGKGFFIDHNSKRVVISESVIDAMSVMSAMKQNGIDYRNYDYLPLAGATKHDAVRYQIRQHDVKQIYLALDNDPAGLENIRLIRDMVSEEFPDVEILECVPDSKDWNQDLQESFLSRENIDCSMFLNESEMPVPDRMDKLVREHMQNDRTLIVNVYGGPGSGQSGVCQRICEELIEAGYNAGFLAGYENDINPESCMEFVRSEREMLDVIKNQMEKMDVAADKADILVVDSPLLQAAAYTDKISDPFRNGLKEIYGQYRNMEIYLRRDKEALPIDRKIQMLLHESGIQCAGYNADNAIKAVQKIRQVLETGCDPDLRGMSGQIVQDMPEMPAAQASSGNSRNKQADYMSEYMRSHPDTGRTPAPAMTMKMGMSM